MPERRIILASEVGIAIRSFSDIPDLLGASMDADGLILTEQDLSPEFFDLGTGLAGEVFQKFTNYKIPVALVIPHANVYGQHFSELAYEHKTHPLIHFVSSVTEAKVWLGAAKV
ncbi:MAG: DUF4180 domain-containing protein [Thermaceae bacterium]|nr:DUF4180 domain-containing protein [Thermaceae bacterium]